MAIYYITIDWKFRHSWASFCLHLLNYLIIHVWVTEWTFNHLFCQYDYTWRKLQWKINVFAWCRYTLCAYSIANCFQHQTFVGVCRSTPCWLVKVILIGTNQRCEKNSRPGIVGDKTVSIYFHKLIYGDIANQKLCYKASSAYWT